MDKVPAYARALLSTREVEVLGLVAAGHGVTDIARALVISRSTVKTHIYRIRRVYGINSLAELRRRAGDILMADSPVPQVAIVCPRCGGHVELLISASAAAAGMEVRRVRRPSW